MLGLFILQEEEEIEESSEREEEDGNRETIQPDSLEGVSVGEEIKKFQQEINKAGREDDILL